MRLSARNLLVCGLLMLWIVGCSKPADDTGRDSVVAGNEVPDAASAESTATTEGPDATDNAADLSGPIELIPVDEVPEATGDGGLQEVLPPGRITRLVPLDITIGRLQDHLDGATRPQYEVTVRLLQGLVTHSIDPELLVAENARRLMRFFMLIEEGEHPPIEYRIGAVLPIASDRARVPLLLFSDIGRAEATVSLERSENQWYIANMAVDYTLFNVEYNDPDERFVPGYYTDL